ncbi:MAG TPA: transcriptional regulator GcvA [Steroidobacteraceae bacterium]|jgi:LysR family glycine cleavage system transcriptional activator|nr:transcriptional regulator GcvA [Steroidobacteraceae bacterium]
MPERRIRKTEPTARSFDRLPLNGLRVFEAVATRLSFASAADALHVTPAAVSMQIRTLEQYLRVPLFRRSGRKIALSAEGALLLPGVRRGLSELQQAMHQLRQDRNRGALNITTIASFLQKWLMPRLPQFYDRNPDIELSIHTSHIPVNFDEGDFHAALRMSAGPTPGLYNEKLLDEWFLPVCSPELLARHGPIRTPADLKRYPLLRSSDESWSMWRRPSPESEWRERGTAFDDSLTVLAAAEHGQGLALTRWALAAHDLASGRIVRASAQAVPCPRSYYFVCPESYLALPKLQQLLKWLREVAALFPAPDSVAAGHEIPAPRKPRLRTTAGAV